MKYAVTGAAGFIGSQLAEALQAAGHDVVGIDSFTDYYDVALKERNARALTVERLDLARDELDFTGFDGVFHLAGQPGVRSFGDVLPLYVERNVLASQRVFEAAAAAGARVVFSSSSSIYGEAERYPTSEQVEPRPVSPYGDGEQSRSFTYVGDVVASTVTAMERAEPGAVLNVGGGEEATMNETIALLESIAGRALDARREEAVAGDQRRTKADTTRIRE